MRGARATALLASPMGSEGTWLSELQTGNGHSWGLCLLCGLSRSTPHSLQGASLFTMG